MTLEELQAKVAKWDLENRDGNPVAASEYSTVLAQLQYHAAREWRVYLPAERPGECSNYMERLAAWVGNAADDSDQKLLLKYALYISFFSHDDFAALYRTALDREVTRWITMQSGVSFLNCSLSQMQRYVANEINRHTWFCPVTDSMDINEFHKVNHLKGIKHRPCFLTLRMLAEEGRVFDPHIATNVMDYMSQCNLTRLILLEDVVGSGSQCLEAIRWASAAINVPVLFVPLILCPNGVETLRNEEAVSGGRLTVRPVITLNRGDVLGGERQGVSGWPISDEVEQLARRVASRASPGMDTFGFSATGCSIATFTNTPDNTLPIVHNRPTAGGWTPLFPRVFRD